jgi:dTMP kinase
MAKQKKKEQTRKAKTKNSKPEPKGHLIALDGASGPMLGEESQRLARLCGEDAAWSSFDASNTFHELRMAKSKTLTPTPRVLVLLYVSDLLFRLRWEVEPTLQEGRTVVVAPYVNTAMAFGIASGLSKEWLDQLFNFAPKPEVSYRLKEKKKGKKLEWKKSDLEVPGFVEFCAATLTKNFPGWDADEVRAAMIGHLKEMEDREELRKLGKKAPKGLK